MMAHAISSTRSMSASLLDNLMAVCLQHQEQAQPIVTKNPSSASTPPKYADLKASWINTTTSISEDFGYLLDDESSSDFEIRASSVHDGQPVTFKVHSLILKTRSPVFRQMLSNQYQESLHSYINIMDVDPTIIQLMITFLYTDEIPFCQTDLKEAKEVFYVASKYNIQRLMTICEARIASLLTPQDAFNTLTFAVDNFALNLQVTTINYINSNPSQSIEFLPAILRPDLATLLWKASINI